MKLSVIIPAYNEAENIEPVVRDLSGRLQALQAIEGYEIIVVDDHSSDNTFDRVQKLQLPAVNCIRLSRRSGSHTAIRAGLVHCKGDAALCISADGQDNPEVLGNMLDKCKSGYQVVWAVREGRKEPMSYRILTGLFYWLLRKLTPQQDTGINLANADFYLLDRPVVDAINACNERNTSLFGLILWLGFNQDHVMYTRKDRLSGKSKWNFRSRLRLARDWMIAFSAIPLKLMLAVGIGIATLGFLYALFIIIYALMGFTPPGWAETVILILIIGGVQMAMLGVTGEYLWRNLDETRKRPLYFIEKQTGKTSQNPTINKNIT